MDCPWCEKDIGNSIALRSADRYDNVVTVACNTCKMPINVVPVRKFRVVKVTQRYHTDEAYDDWGVRYNDNAILPLTPEEALERLGGK